MNTKNIKAKLAQKRDMLKTCIPANRERLEKEIEVLENLLKGDPEKMAIHKWSATLPLEKIIGFGFPQCTVKRKGVSFEQSVDSTALKNEINRILEDV